MTPEIKPIYLKKFKLVCLLISIILFLASASSNKTLKLYEKADKYYNERKYEQALKFYYKIISHTGFDEKAYLQAARCSHYLEKYSDADQYYTQLFYKSEKVEPILFLEYGELLMKLDRQDEARSYFSSYNNLMENNDLRVLRYIESIEHYDKYLLDSSFVSIRKLAKNREGDDLNPLVYAGRLFYESNTQYYKASPVMKDIYSINPDAVDAASHNKILGRSINKSKLAGFTVARETGEIILSIQPETSDGNYSLFRLNGV